MRLFAAALISTASIINGASLSEDAVTDNIQWIQHGRSVILKTDLLGLPLLPWNSSGLDAGAEDERMGPSSAVVLNFTLSDDTRTLLLQDIPFLPLQDPNVPPYIWGRQVPVDLGQEELMKLVQEGWFDFSNSSIRRNEELDGIRNWEWGTIGLSYDRFVTPRDDEAITYYDYLFTLTLDIMGAEFWHETEEDVEEDNIAYRPNRFRRSKMTLLESPKQAQAVIKLSDVDPEEASTSPTRSFTINSAALRTRAQNKQWIAVQPHANNQCTIRSWRCADLDDAPYYRYIWHQEFDERYGRIGSLRFEVVKTWTVASTFANSHRRVTLILGLILATFVMSQLYVVGRLLTMQQRTKNRYSWASGTSSGSEESAPLLDQDASGNESNINDVRSYGALDKNLIVGNGHFTISGSTPGYSLADTRSPRSVRKKPSKPYSIAAPSERRRERTQIAEVRRVSSNV